jgi:alkylation response protein AidB-like acyl-CoA dehydrogenase
MMMSALAPDDTYDGPVIPLEPTPQERLLRESVAAVVAKFGHSYFMEKTKAGEPPSELWAALGEKGYLGACLPEEWDGGGQGMWALQAVAEELAAAGCPLIPLVFSQAICGNVIAKYGTDAQKERWLRGIANSTLKLSFAITEPDAGSNSHNLATTARRDGDGWILNGTKTYISGVEDADAVMIVARTGRDEKSGRGLLSLFIVEPDVPGFTRQHIPTAIQAPEKQWTLFFDDVQLDGDALIGEQDRGLRIVFEGLNPERILGATVSIGIGRYALDKATAYAKERSVWGVPIAQHQAVAHPLAKAKVELECARLMVRKACALYDAGSPAAGEACNMAKYIAAEAGVNCLDAAIQCHGGNGVALEYGLTDMWWLARLMKIAPVSAEMVLNFVAEHTLGLPKSY